MMSELPRERRRRRGRDIAYVPQDPATGLSPGMRVGQALREMIDVHGVGGWISRRESRKHSATPSFPDDEAFQCPVPAPAQRRSAAARRDRACARLPAAHHGDGRADDRTRRDDSGAAVGCRTRDHRESKIALVYVTHDLGVVRNLVDEVVVMYGGRIVETSPVDDLFTRPTHPYTRRLLEAVPRILPIRSSREGFPAWPSSRGTARRLSVRAEVRLS